MNISVEQSLDVHLTADALHRIADLVAAGRVTVLPTGWHVAAYDYQYLAEDVAEAMTVTECRDWHGEFIDRRCRTVVGTLAGHPVTLTYTTDDHDWHGAKVGEATAEQVAAAILTPDAAEVS